MCFPNNTSDAALPTRSPSCCPRREIPSRRTDIVAREWYRPPWRTRDRSTAGGPSTCLMFSSSRPDGLPPASSAAARRSKDERRRPPAVSRSRLRRADAEGYAGGWTSRRELGNAYLHEFSVARWGATRCASCRGGPASPRRWSLDHATSCTYERQERAAVAIEPHRLDDTAAAARYAPRGEGDAPFLPDDDRPALRIVGQLTPPRGHNQTLARLRPTRRDRRRGWSITRRHGGCVCVGSHPRPEPPEAEISLRISAGCRPAAIESLGPPWHGRRARCRARAAERGDTQRGGARSVAERSARWRRTVRERRSGRPRTYHFLFRGSQALPQLAQRAARRPTALRLCGLQKRRRLPIHDASQCATRSLGSTRRVEDDLARERSATATAAAATSTDRPLGFFDVSSAGATDDRVKPREDIEDGREAR